MSELYDEGIIGLNRDEERRSRPFDESQGMKKPTQTRREGRSRVPRHPNSTVRSITPDPSPTRSGSGSVFSTSASGNNSRSSSANSRSTTASRRERDRPWRDKNPQQSSSSLTSSQHSQPQQQINRVDSSDSFDSLGRMVQKDDLSSLEQKTEKLDEISVASSTNSSKRGPPESAFHVHSQPRATVIPDEPTNSYYIAPSEPPPMSSAPPNPPPPPPSEDQPPPSPLFTNSRWSQYEENPDELQREANLASATAVASAAERAAYRQVQNTPHPETSGESVLVLSMEQEDSHEHSSENSDDYNEELSLMTEDYNAERGGKPLTPKQHASRWDDYDDPTGRVPVEKRLRHAGASLPPPPPERNRAGSPVLGSIGRSFRNGGAMLMSAVLGTNSKSYDEEDDDLVDFRNRKNGSNQHDRVRAEALKMLELAEDATGTAAQDSNNPSAIGNNTGTLRKTKTGGWTSAQDNDEGMGMRRPENGKRLPSALQGMDLGMSHKENEQRNKKYDGARKRLYSEDEDDDGVDVVKTSIGGFGGSPRTVGPFHNGDGDDDASLLEEDYLNGQEGGGNSKSWSQRYSITPHLRAMTGGKMASSTDVLRAMEDQHHPNKSATNMFKSSAYNIDGASRVQLNGKEHSPNVHSAVIAPKALWMDVDLAERSSLPPPPHPNVRSSPLEVQKDRVKRRKVYLALAVLVATALIIGLALGAGATIDNNNDNNGLPTFGAPPGSRFSFYATSNVPVSDESGKSLARELADVPADSFVVHLGDVGRNSETFCDDDVYAEASTILEASTAPVFVLPGNQDWNDCPDPDVAWKRWEDHLGRFEEHFPQSFDVGRQLGRNENFVFLHEGVLFMGVNLVNGLVHDRSEWNKRHAQNVLWTEQNLQLYEYHEYRAIVILGHSPPYDLLTDYFHPILDDLARVKKPVLYLHANNEGGFREYKPFGSGENKMLAVEVDKGGEDSTFVKVTVDFGSSPFTFDRDQSFN